MDTAIPAAAGPAGAVPDGAARAGVPLTLARDSGGALNLQWGPSCSAADEDYSVYAGTLGDFTSHAPVTCTTNGYTRHTLVPTAPDAYYLVVPHTADSEGSYGLRPGPAERPASSAACLPRTLAACAGP